MENKPLKEFLEEITEQGNTDLLVRLILAYQETYEKTLVVQKDLRRQILELKGGNE